jgi:hypothetical protein
MLKTPEGYKEKTKNKEQRTKNKKLGFPDCDLVVDQFALAGVNDPNIGPCKSDCTLLQIWLAKGSRQ